MSKDDHCPFAIVIFCHSQDKKWYLSCGSTKYHSQLHHTEHIRVYPDRLFSQLKHIPDSLIEFINNHLHERVAPAVIVGSVK